MDSTGQPLLLDDQRSSESSTRRCFDIHHCFIGSPAGQFRFTSADATRFQKLFCHTFSVYGNDPRFFTHPSPFTKDCLKNDDELLPALRREILHDLIGLNPDSNLFQQIYHDCQPLLFSARLSVKSPNTELVPLTAASLAAALSDVSNSFDRHGYAKSPVHIYIHTEHLRHRSPDQPAYLLSDFYSTQQSPFVPSNTPLSDRKIRYFNPNPSPSLLPAFSPPQPEPPLDAAALPPTATPRQSTPHSDPAAQAPLVPSPSILVPPIFFFADISPISNHGRVSPSSLSSTSDNNRPCSVAPSVNSLADDDPTIYATNTRATPASHSYSSNSSVATPISSVPSSTFADPSDSPVARPIYSLSTMADSDSSHPVSNLPPSSPPLDYSSSLDDSTTNGPYDESYYDGDPFYQHTDDPSPSASSPSASIDDPSSQRAYIDTDVPSPSESFPPDYIDKSYYDDANDRYLDPNTLHRDTDFDYYYDNNENCYLYDDTDDYFTDSYGNSYF